MVNYQFVYRNTLLTGDIIGTGGKATVKGTKGELNEQGAIIRPKNAPRGPGAITT